VHTLVQLVYGIRGFWELTAAGAMSGFLSTAMLPVVTPVAMGLAAGTATGVVLASSVLGALYARGYRRLGRLGRMAIIRPFHAVAFAGATGALALAFSAPLAALAPQVFSVHVLQHLLLFCVAAPLFVRSRVVVALVWALSSRTRHAIVAGWKALGLASAAGAVARPAASWLVFVVSFVLSQLAALFGWFTVPPHAAVGALKACEPVLEPRGMPPHAARDWSSPESRRRRSMWT
jgi:hypothetical protein